MTRVPLSILDVSPVSEGSTVRQALRNTIDLAQHAEKWGYLRYWVTEHHFVAMASSSPAVLIGLIAAATDRIRVGSAAVQIGHLTAAAVVEAFGTIDALYPDRIDLGLGRSPQRRADAAAGKPESETPREPMILENTLFPRPFRMNSLLASKRLVATGSVLQQPGAVVPDFEDQLDAVIALIDGTFEVADGVHLSVTPGEGASVQLWLFGSSGGQSAQAAGARGLPFVANYHLSPGTVLDAVEAYRNAFVPSSTLDEPYLVVSADVLVAETDSEAEYLAMPFAQWAYSVRSGDGAIPYPNPQHVDGQLAPEHAALVEDRIATRFVGTAATVADKLDGLRRATGAQELVVTTITHNHRDRLRSHELLAKEWGLTPRPAHFPRA